MTDRWPEYDFLAEKGRSSGEGFYYEEGASICNLAFKRGHPIRSLPRSRLRRWWMRHTGWTLYEGWHGVGADA